jgi:hypothetical protein
VAKVAAVATAVTLARLAGLVGPVVGAAKGLTALALAAWAAKLRAWWPRAALGLMAVTAARAVGERTRASWP